MPRNRMKSSRPALVALGAFLLAVVDPVWAQEVKGRVVVLGFDGADHRLVSQFLAEGKLPNLAKLAQQGSFSPLRPTIPAQTPVSWSTFSTGLSPGRTQIFDFLKRDPKTYRPEFAIATEGKRDFLLGRGNRAGAAAAGALLAFLLVFALGRLTLKKTVPAAVVALVLAAPAGFFSWRFGGLLPESLQTVRNNRKGTPFWEVAGAKGIKSVVLHVPVTFPAV
ncbi:MAG TPA: alkaline phosphatase family protein, partial [Thermoanaerobaculia bacterium]|nr:alkaline phosphatase family protein [Thermoanaerobaculia bacterium]